MMMLAVDAKSGEILAYVSEPAADLMTYPESSDSERKDRPALYRYEPGSVFVITSYSIHYTKLYDPRPPALPPGSGTWPCAGPRVLWGSNELPLPGVRQ